MPSKAGIGSTGTAVGSAGTAVGSTGTAVGCTSTGAVVGAAGVQAATVMLTKTKNTTTLKSDLDFIFFLLGKITFTLTRFY
jgi:hypothetical protein